MSTLRRSLFRPGATTIVTLAALVTVLEAAQKESPTAKAEKLVLFDGKSLDGWKSTGFTGSGEVKVQDGAIKMDVGRRMTGITTTRNDIPKTDYELTYEARRLTGNDFFAAATFPVGDSYITFVNGGWGGGITGVSSIDGMDASENETGRYFKYQDKTWYKFRVRVTAAAIRCSIDDKEVVAVNHEGRKVSTRIETRSNQPLGFSTFESAGEVRKIEIRKLAPAEVAVVNKVEP